MTGVITRLAALAAMLLVSGVAVGARAEAGGEGGEGTELWAVWSVTAIGEYTSIPSPENDDDVGGWFDQYEFTPNKSSDFPFQLGLRDAALDVFRGETAIFQARLWSPSSNLGVSGSEADEPFFNQRLEALTRLKGQDLDLSYRRIRTEQPESVDAPVGRVRRVPEIGVQRLVGDVDRRIRRGRSRF